VRASRSHARSPCSALPPTRFLSVSPRIRSPLLSALRSPSAPCGSLGGLRPTLRRTFTSKSSPMLGPPRSNGHPAGWPLSFPEGPAGFEPANGGFADRCVTTSPRARTAPGTGGGAPPETRSESGKPDSNRRPSAWQADALPTELFPRYRHPNCTGEIAYSQGSDCGFINTGNGDSDRGCVHQAGAPMAAS
jgi:hypothetical protein